MKPSAEKISYLALVLALIAAALAYMPGAVVEASDGGGHDAVPQAMPVEVDTIKPESVQVWKKFSGHVVAVDQAEIRPQVSGRITEIKFEDGQHVEKGQVLMIIDPRPYEAALNQAKAALAAAQTQASLAEKEYKRSKELIKTEAISQRLLDERTNNREVAAAAVQGAQAMVQSAEINLDYAYVKSPIDGKVSRAEITEGNLVQSGPGAPLLTSVVSDDKVYVDFDVDDQTYLSSIQNRDRGNVGNIPVRLELLGSAVKYEGHVHSFDNRIDAASGTIRARALFQNENKALLPGMSVTVLMGSTGSEGQILVSERAIGTDQDRKFVYVVGEGNQATYREVKIGQSINGKRIVLEGLQEGDVVITEGIVRIRPNMPVMPKTSSIEKSGVIGTPGATEQ